MATETQPRDRDDLAAGTEYAEPYVDVGEAALLLEPGDVVRVTRAANPPAPARLRLLESDGVSGADPDGRVWDIEPGAETTVGPADGEGSVKLIGFALVDKA